MALGVQRRIAGEPAVQLEEPGLAVQVELTPLVEQVRGLHLGYTSELRLERANEHGRCRCVGLGRRPDFHAGTSSSNVSATPDRSASSLVGFGSAGSARRLIQTERRPSSFAGATSWKRLAATWTWPSRGAPVSS